MQTAEECGSTLIVANDPDADRLAIAEKLPKYHTVLCLTFFSGDWKIFTGNEIGILLADYSWQQYKKVHEKDADFDPKQCVVLNSTVSSKMLASLAKTEGIYYEDTLTGFKWLGNKADELRKKGKKFIFAFEEAIGFMVGDTCLDKDGIRAGAVFTEMAIGLFSNKKTCVERLEELYLK
jgi:phosphomannomutase